MGYYLSVRGWLQCYEEFTAVKNVISKFYEDHADDPSASLYRQGWCWSNEQINWISYIFYGADVKAQSLEQFESLLGLIAAASSETEGYFHLQGEDNDNCYEIFL